MASNEELNEQNGLYNQLINKAQTFQNIQTNTESSYQNLTDLMKDAISSTKKIREYTESINKIQWDQSNALKSVLSHYAKRFKEAKNIYKTENDIKDTQKNLGKAKENAYNKALKAASQENEEQFNIYNSIVQQIEKEQAELQVQEAQNKALKEQIDRGGILYKIYGNIHKYLGGMVDFLNNMGKTLLPIIGSLFNGIANTLKRMVNFVGEVFDTFLDIQSITGNLQADLGLTNQQFNTIRENASAIADEALRYGMNYEEALNLTREVSELTGKNRAILSDQTEILAKIAKTTGLGAEGSAKIYSNFRLLGKPLEQTGEQLDTAVDRSTTLGLNVTKVLNTTSDIVEETSGLRFENGIKGITNLVQKAQSLRVEIGNLTELADDFMKPEDAIEKAANLRVLGGAFGDMADPMQLMYEAQNAPNKLAEGFLDAAKNLAVYNEELGRFEIPTKQRMRMKEVAESTSMEFEQLKNAALQGAQNMKLMDQVAPEAKRILSDDQLKGIANMAKMTEEGKGYIQLTSGDELKKNLSNLHELSNKQLQQLAQRTDSEREIAMTRKNIIEQFENLYSRFQVAFLPLFNALDGMLKDSGFMKELRLSFDELQKLIENSLVPLFNEGGPVYNVFKGLGESLRGALETFRKSFDPNGDVWNQISSGFMNLASSFADSLMKYLEPAFKNIIRIAVSETWGALGLGDYDPDLEKIPTPTDSKSKSSQTGLKTRKVDDFIYNPKSKEVIDFNKDDLVMGGSNLSGENQQSKVEETVKDINVNVNGTIKVESENDSINLTQNDLRQIVSKEVVQKIKDEMLAMERSGGIKKTNPTPPL